MQTGDITATNAVKSIGSLPHDRPMGPTLAQSDGVVGPNRIKWTAVFANRRERVLLRATHDGKGFMGAAKQLRVKGMRTGAPAREGHPRLCFPKPRLGSTGARKWPPIAALVKAAPARPPKHPAHFFPSRQNSEPQIFLPRRSFQPCEVHDDTDTPLPAATAAIPADQAF
jgi:hypothetical protein